MKRQLTFNIGMEITTTGTEFWEIESDELASVFEEIANEHAAHWQETVDGMAQQENVLPPPPAAPWSSLEAAMRECERVALLAVALTPSKRYVARPDDVTVTVRPMARAS
jgi:hypothetical protein